MNHLYEIFGFTLQDDFFGKNCINGFETIFIIDTLQENSAEDLNGLFKPLRDLCDMKEVSFELITRSCNFSLAKSVKQKNKKVILRVSLRCTLR